jgi:hypothetical protein
MRPVRTAGRPFHIQPSDCVSGSLRKLQIARLQAVIAEFDTASPL